MNVVAKSTNVLPFVKATATGITSGAHVTPSITKLQRPAIVHVPTLTRVNGLTSQDILSGPLRVSSGIGVSCNVHQARYAHTDIQVPDFTAYRKSETVDVTYKSNKNAYSRKNMTYLIGAVGGVITMCSAKSMVLGIVGYVSPAKDVLAVSKIEVNIGNIPEGKNVVFKWRGKPVFVRHRSANEIAREQAVNVSELRDPQPDADRVQRPDWLVVIGVCTHLGCVPIANAGAFGGYYCPCHGSHYDASGRIRKGPAPLNLEVPPHEFLDNSVLRIG